MSYLTALHQNWETLAGEDPLWAILSDPARKGRKWDKGAFFATGANEVAVMLERVKKTGLAVDHAGPLLDFGCGVGRLTRAFAGRFQSCVGVDISPAMITQADAFNQDAGRCSFRVNVRPDLKIFADGFFGFIYSSLVLQHMRPALSLRYLGEFGRVLKDGGIAVVQLVDNANLSRFQSIKQAVRLRTRLLNFVDRHIMRKHRDAAYLPIYCCPEKKIRALAKENGLSIVDVSFTNSADKDFNGSLRYLDCPPAQGYVSKQYIFVKGTRR